MMTILLIFCGLASLIYWLVTVRPWRWIYEAILWEEFHPEWKEWMPSMSAPDSAIEELREKREWNKRLWEQAKQEWDQEKPKYWDYE